MKKASGFIRSEASYYAFECNLVSEDYVPGVSGWIKKGNGDEESNNGVFRGSLQAAKIASNGFAFHKDYPAILLPPTSGKKVEIAGNGASEFITSLITIYGAGLKAVDPANALANANAWGAEAGARQATYDALYASYDSDGYDDNGTWVSGIDAGEQAALDAQAVQVAAAFALYNYWSQTYAATSVSLDLCFCREHVTFNITTSSSYQLNEFDAAAFQPIYRINGGTWLNSGPYEQLGYKNENRVVTWPLSLDLAPTDRIEFGIHSWGPRNRFCIVGVGWSN